MKKGMILLAVCFLVMSFSLVQANPIYTINAEIGPSPGGPFSLTGPGGLFQTFCVETQEYINVPGTYYGTIDSVVMFSSHNSATDAPLNDNTKRLYSYFLDTPGFTSTQLEDIQKAIWDYQDQPGYDGTQASNPYYIAAPTYTLDHTVSVLNLWTADNSNLFEDKAQSMLIQTTTVPEPLTILLFGTGLVGLGLSSRKFRR